jgi:hypothetical protein
MVDVDCSFENFAPIRAEETSICAAELCCLFSRRENGGRLRDCVG